MTPFKEAELAPAIQSCVDAVEQAKATLENTLAEVQASCEHRIVAEMPYRSPNFNAERICLHCRFIEEGSHWSGGSTWWVKDHTRQPVLGNEEGRIVKEVSRDDFWALRVSP